jgi:hypothetical protein
MEKIIEISQNFKGIIEASPWIWHGIQVLALLNFIRGVYWKIDWYTEKIIFSFLGSLYGWMFYSFGIISIEGFLIILFLYVFQPIVLFSNKYKIILLWKLIEPVFMVSILIAFSNLNLLDLALFLYIWGVNFVIGMMNFAQTLIFPKYSEEKIVPEIVPNSLFYDPISIGLILLPNSWFIWVLGILTFLAKNLDKDPFPLFSLRNQNVLFDDVGKINIKKLHFPFFIFFLSYFLMQNWYANSNSLTTIFLFNGAFILIISYQQILRRNFTNTFKKYGSFSLVSGNYRFIAAVTEGRGFLNLLQRFNLENYAILATPYDTLVVSNTKTRSKEELAVNSHHLVLLDGGEDSSRIVEMEKEFSNFLGRVDTVIDFFAVPGQEMDEYSEPIASSYASTIRDRIAVKQSIIDEKSTVVDRLSEDVSKAVDLVVNSINSEPVRINMLVKPYFMSPSLEYNQLQNELVNKGPFEINTLLRQMREGASIPSRFVDALTIAEVGARFIFSLVNEINFFLEDKERKVNFRNEKYGQLSFGICIGFLRNLLERRKLNVFEKSVKTILKTEYLDAVNFSRLQKYLLEDLHYDKAVNDSPTLFDLFNYLGFIRNKTRGHGTPSKVEFEFYVTLDLISIFITHCLSKIEFETYTRQTIHEKEWLLFYNAGGNVVLHPLNEEENLDYWEHTFDWQYLDKMEAAKEQLTAENQSVYFKLSLNNSPYWVPADTYFKCKEGIIYMYDGINKGEAEWISFTTGAVIRPYRIL